MFSCVISCIVLYRCFQWLIAWCRNALPLVLCRVASCRIMSHRVMSCCFVVSCCCVPLDWTVLRCVLLCPVVQCRVVCVMLYRFVSRLVYCYVMTFCVALCSAVL